MITQNAKFLQAAVETGNKGIRKATAALRQAGFMATTFPMGMQVTPVGRIKLTMIDVRPGTNETTYGAGDIIRKFIPNIDW